MKTMLAAAFAAMIGIGVANAEPVNNAPVPAPQDSTASWANG
jgi:hypothetical protein